MKPLAAVKLTGLCATLSLTPCGVALAQDATAAIEAFSTICVTAVERPADLEAVTTGLGFTASTPWRNNKVVSLQDFRTDRNLVSVEAQTFETSQTVDCLYQTDIQLGLDDVQKLKSRLEQFPLIKALQGDVAMSRQPGQGSDALNAAFRTTVANPSTTVSVYSVPKFTILRLYTTTFKP